MTGIKYTNEEDIKHLLSAIKAKYPVKVKMDPDQYIGITLKWNYATRELICSMAGYVKSALKELEHVLPKSFFCSPSPYQEPKFGQKL